MSAFDTITNAVLRRPDGTRVSAFVCDYETQTARADLRCTLSEHDGPFHKDDRQNTTWCEWCECLATDHMTEAQMDVSDPVIRKDGSLATCGACGECPAILPEGWC